MKPTKLCFAASRLATSSVLQMTVLWPSLVQALSPLFLIIFVAFIFTLFLPISSLDTNSVIPMSHSKLSSSKSSHFNKSLKNSLNASFTNVINRHLTTIRISHNNINDNDKTKTPLPPVELDERQYDFLLEEKGNKYRFNDKLPVVKSRRYKRSSLFGRKRQNGHLGGLGGKGNHTGPPPNYLEPWTANPNYWIPDRYHENTVCLLATFAGIVRIRPSNSTFRGGTFSISPEESLGRRANCERNSRNMFWKFSQSDEREVANEDDEEYDVNLEGEQTVAAARKDTSKGRSSSSSSSRSSRVVLVERSNRLLSAGFHVVGSVIEFHVAYIECLQQADKNVLNGRYRVYGDGVCVNLSVSFDMGSFGDRFAYECHHIWGKTLKDVHYNQNRRNYAGEVQISLKMVRLDKDPLGYPPYSFRKSRRRCAWDSVLSWQSISITLTLLVLFIVGFFALCVCSNSNCSSEEGGGGQSLNWCLCTLCCCRCCRRRRRGALPSRPLVERTQPPNRPTANHLNHSNYRSHAPPPPPPPPAPPSSSMSSSRNATTYSRKPTFSTTSYSYDGNGSNPTGQSSSAMSTALETDDDESVNGGVGNGLKHQLHLQSHQGSEKRKIFAVVCSSTQKKLSKLSTKAITVAQSNTNCSPCLLTLEYSGDDKLEQHKLPFRFISTASHGQLMRRYLEQIRCQWLKKLSSHLKHERTSLQLTETSLAVAKTPSSNNTDNTDVIASQLFYLYFLYWQAKIWKMKIDQLPRPAYRDLSSQCVSTPTKLVTCRRAAYHPNASIDLLSPSL